MSELQIYQVDSFTRERFRGNPAAVCLLDDWLNDDQLQAIAAEMNLSETAFLRPRDDGGLDLRWMTPVFEVDLCGHATLAAAHVLWRELGRDLGRPILFHSRSGLLTATARGDQIELDFPAVPAQPQAPPAGMCEALGVSEFDFSGRNEMDWLIVLADVQRVLDLRPDFGRLATVEARGVIVSAEADSEHKADFVSRFFAPAAGIDEDPVTGSAHCCLAPYWSERLNATALTGYQASPRGGFVGTEVSGDRVKLLGEAVTVMRGVLLA